MSEGAVDISRLSRDEQLELLDRLWEILGHDPEALPLTEAQRRELDHRLDDLESESPGVGIAWDELVARLRSPSR
jgi:putative addiction module component (TIGR02574 family)